MTELRGEDTVSLPEAARLLGVHYMTAYRYVRTGRLEASSVAGVWQVEREAIEHFLRPPLPRAPLSTEGTAGARGHAASAEMMERRLVEGDLEGAFSICDVALGSWAHPSDLYLELLAPALRSIGDKWERGELTVADEHRAVGVATRVVGRLGPSFARPGRRRGSVVIGAPSGDAHGLPVAFVSDLLRASGFGVVDLGANTPASAVVDAARGTDRLCSVALGATLGGNEVEIATAVGTLHAAVPHVPVVLGGAGVPTEELSRQLGADHWSGPDGRTLVALLERLAPRGGASAR